VECCLIMEKFQTLQSNSSHWFGCPAPAKCDMEVCKTVQANRKTDKYWNVLSLLFADWIILKGLWAPTLIGFVTLRFFFHGAKLEKIPPAITHATWMNWKPTYCDMTTESPNSSTRKVVHC
jgi:hypothetical protein